MHVSERAKGPVDADINIKVERNAFGFHLAHAPFDRLLLHLEIGNAVAQEPARLRISFEDMYLVAHAGELLGRG
jgi:hypothetical protein